jgi:hypothetical protein
MDARGSFTTLRAEFPDAGVPLRALAEPATPFWPVAADAEPDPGTAPAVASEPDPAIAPAEV